MTMKMRTRLATVAALLILAGSAAEAEENDDANRQARIAAQGICPVSGIKLGDHGDPIPATLDSDGLQGFLCCQACKGRDASAEHLATVRRNFARAQGICPVMENELPEDAESKVVRGRLVYVCCPPCFPKIEADPTKYLAVVDQLYRKAAGDADDPDASDQRGEASLLQQVQRLCPVSGESLQDRGGAVPTLVGQQRQQVYLCCTDCASGSLDQQHWRTMHEQLATAQGICPVMESPLPDGAKWTIALGRIVYVCCPPCIDKIDADPQIYLDHVDRSYRQSLTSKPSSPGK